MCSSDMALACQGFGDFLTELPAGPPARRRLAQGQGQSQGQAEGEGVDSQLKSTQFNVAAFQRQPDRVVRCTAAATCYPELAREAAAVVAIFSVDLELGVSGLCTGAPPAASWEVFERSLGLGLGLVLLGAGARGRRGVAIFSVDLELGVSGLCTGAPLAPD